MTKPEQRKLISERVRSLDPSYMGSASDKIKAYLTDCEEWKSADKVFMYHSTGFEVDTAGIIDAALQADKRVYLPRVISDTDMEFSEYVKDAHLTKGRYGIMEPDAAGEDTKASIKPDLIIIPCVGADRQLRRLGHGKGYYDRYLKRFKDVKKICLAFDVQLVDFTVTEDEDVKMDAVLTESGFIGK